MMYFFHWSAYYYRVRIIKKFIVHHVECISELIAEIDGWIREVRQKLFGNFSGFREGRDTDYRS